MSVRPKFKSTDTFYVLDLDRHLVDTIKLNNILEEVTARTTRIPLSLMRRAREEVEKTGGSFDTAEYIKPVLEEHGHPLERLMEDFVSTARNHDVYEPGAIELLALMEASALPFAIVTYGGTIWQKAKIRAAKLEHIAYIITPVKEKGALIDSWHQPLTQTFRLPIELSRDVDEVSTVMLLDDKASSFIGLPESASGIHVLPRDKEALSVQMGRVGSNVIVVKGLYEAIDHIKQYLGNDIDKA